MAGNAPYGVHSEHIDINEGGLPLGSSLSSRWDRRRRSPGSSPDNIWFASSGTGSRCGLVKPLGNL